MDKYKNILKIFSVYRDRDIIIKDILDEIEDIQNNKKNLYDIHCIDFSVFSKNLKKTDLSQKVYKIIDVYDTRLEYLNKELQKINETIELYILLMESLSSVEKKIIFYFYIEKLRWVEIAQRVSYTERHCRRLKADALEKIQKKFDVIYKK